MHHGELPNGAAVVWAGVELAGNKSPVLVLILTLSAGSHGSVQTHWTL